MKIVLVIWLALAGVAAAHDIVVHADRPRHEVLGFGAQVWDGDPGAYALFPAANLTWMRLNLRDFFLFDRADLPPEEYYEHWKRTINWDRIYYMRAIRDANKLKLILVSFHVPPMWLDEKRTLRAEHADQLVALWLAALRAYVDEGLKPDYIELFNEPDGSWGGIVPPELYSRIASGVRRGLIEHGLSDIRIVGPGLARIDLPDGDPYIDALDEEGRAAHDAWSIHGWEWHNQEDPGYVRDIFARGFMASVGRADPARAKPVMLTEFSTKATRFHGIAYTPHDKHYRDTSADTPAFAARVVENALSFLNGGANVLIHWQATDQWWEDAAWGLAGRVEDGYPTRPVYHALKLLFRAIPTGSRVLDVEQSGTGLYAAAFVRPDGARVLALVNGGAEEARARVQVSGAAPGVWEGAVWDGKETTPLRVEPNEEGIVSFALPPDGVAVATQTW